MKLSRVLSRLALLSLAAAALVGLTEIYGRSAQPWLPDAVAQAEKQHQPSAPEIGYFSEFFGWGMWLVICAVTGRLIFRLRLNPAPRGEGQSILLDLHRGRRESLKPSAVPAGPSSPGC